MQEPDGSWQAVTASVREAHPGGITVYNFEVGQDHTYFVADADTSFSDPVWVHNVCFRQDVFDHWRNRLGRRIHPNREAHHIVPQGHPEAQNLRDLLGRNGVGVHDVNNGVPLLHNRHMGEIHRNADSNRRYIQAVEARLAPLDGMGAERIKQELDDIGMELFRGTFTF